MLAAAAVAALLLSACAADDEVTVVDEATVVDDAAAPAESELLPTVSGGQIDTNSLEGSDTILWFWAPW